jgi:hypothetical protein
MMWMMPEMLPNRDRACCLLAFSNQYRYHTTCAILLNPGASSGKRESGERTLAGSQMGYRLDGSNCDAKPDSCRMRAATISLC